MTNNLSGPNQSPPPTSKDVTTVIREGILKAKVEELTADRIRDQLKVTTSLYTMLLAAIVKRSGTITISRDELRDTKLQGLTATTEPDGSLTLTYRD